MYLAIKKKKDPKHCSCFTCKINRYTLESMLCLYVKKMHFSCTNVDPTVCVYTHGQDCWYPSIKDIPLLSLKYQIHSLYTDAKWCKQRQEHCTCLESVNYQGFLQHAQCQKGHKSGVHSHTAKNTQERLRTNHWTILKWPSVRVEGDEAAWRNALTAAIFSRRLSTKYIKHWFSTGELRPKSGSRTVLDGSRTGGQKK